MLHHVVLKVRLAAKICFVVVVSLLLSSLFWTVFSDYWSPSKQLERQPCPHLSLKGLPSQLWSSIRLALSIETRRANKSSRISPSKTKPNERSWQNQLRQSSTRHHDIDDVVLETVYLHDGSQNAEQSLAHTSAQSTGLDTTTNSARQILLGHVSGSPSVKDLVHSTNGVLLGQKSRALRNLENHDGDHVVRKHVLFPTLPQSFGDRGCRCEYPGENLYPEVGDMSASKSSRSANGGSKGSNSDDDRSSSKGNSSDGVGTFVVVRGVLVLPKHHLTCRNVEFRCSQDHNSDGALWTCPFDKKEGKGRGRRGSKRGKGSKGNRRKIVLLPSHHEACRADCVLTPEGYYCPPVIVPRPEGLMPPVERPIAMPESPEIPSMMFEFQGMVPDLQGSVPALPEGGPEAAQQPDTTIEVPELTAEAQETSHAVPELALESPEFVFELLDELGKWPIGPTDPPVGAPPSPTGTPATNTPASSISPVNLAPPTNKTPFPSFSSLPSVEPSLVPSNVPSISQQPSPSPSASGAPSSSSSPSFEPSLVPSNLPSWSDRPSSSPSGSLEPSFVPSSFPSMSVQPSASGEPIGSSSPVAVPSQGPTSSPPSIGSNSPMAIPPQTPSRSPTQPGGTE